MNPHFVFNALNAVLACKGNSDAVTDVTESLAGYLRFLHQKTRPLEPLARELDALVSFLTVQASHFDGNLICRIHADSASRAVMVPPLMIQPLLENAFHYRPRTAGVPLHIWLTASLENDVLRVTVSSTGEWDPAEGAAQCQNGIHAMRQRLKLLMGSSAEVERHTEDGWIRVSIHIPMADSPSGARG